MPLAAKYTARNTADLADHSLSIAEKEETKAASYRKKAEADKARVRGEAFREAEEFLRSVTIEK